jgi:hypothetical protein
MTTTMAKSGQLTDAQRQQFERDGYLCPVRVFEDSEVKHYLSCYVDYTARNKDRLKELKPNQKYTGALGDALRLASGV